MTGRVHSQFDVLSNMIAVPDTCRKVRYVVTCTLRVHSQFVLRVHLYVQYDTCSCTYNLSTQITIMRSR